MFLSLVQANLSAKETELTETKQRLSVSLERSDTLDKATSTECEASSPGIDIGTMTDAGVELGPVSSLGTLTKPTDTDGDKESIASAAVDDVTMTVVSDLSVNLSTIDEDDGACRSTYLSLNNVDGTGQSAKNTALTSVETGVVEIDVERSSRHTIDQGSNAGLNQTISIPGTCDNQLQYRSTAAATATVPKAAENPVRSESTVDASEADDSKASEGHYQDQSKANSRYLMAEQCTNAPLNNQQVLKCPTSGESGAILSTQHLTTTKYVQLSLASESSTDRPTVTEMQQSVTGAVSTTDPNSDCTIIASPHVRPWIDSSQPTPDDLDMIAPTQQASVNSSFKNLNEFPHLSGINATACSSRLISMPMASQQGVQPRSNRFSFSLPPYVASSASTAATSSILGRSSASFAMYSPKPSNTKPTEASHTHGISASTVPSRFGYASMASMSATAALPESIGSSSHAKATRTGGTSFAMSSTLPFEVTPRFSKETETCSGLFQYMTGTLDRTDTSPPKLRDRVSTAALRYTTSWLGAPGPGGDTQGVASKPLTSKRDSSQEQWPDFEEEFSGGSDSQYLVSFIYFSPFFHELILSSL